MVVTTFWRVWLLGIVSVVGIVATATAQDRKTYRYKDGREVYERICQGCHMPDAKGASAAGTYPALAGNEKLTTPLYVVTVVLNGLKSMPSFADLSDDEIAAVTNYVRSNFGNAFESKVSSAEVRSLRPVAVAPRTGRAG